MSSPAKPFACSVAECGMTFTNEDRLTEHSKKHDMALQLGLGQKTDIFPADQTPTPTRFIRTCEEAGLFQELQSVSNLQSVNPFDEGFKRAMDSKSGMLISLDSAIAAATSDDALHTPHVFPNLTDVSDSGLFNTSTTKHTVTRSTSDEGNAVKHFETSTIEKTEVTIGKNTQNINPSSVIKIQSNIEIRKSDYSTVVASNNPNLITLVSNDKDLNVVRKDVMLTDTGKVPVMSQQSLDFAIDSLTSHVETVKDCEKEVQKNQALINTMKRNMKNALTKNCTKMEATNDTKDEKKTEVRKRGKKRKSTDTSDIANENYEVMLKLPNGELLHMKSGDKSQKPVTDAKQRLKDAIESKLKTEIESQIRTDIENKIKSEIQMGQYILRVKDPDTINAAVIPSFISHYKDQIIVKVAETKPAKQTLYPVMIAPKNSLLIPVKKVGIPRGQFATESPKKTLTRRRKKEKGAVVERRKSVQHKSDCDILHKLGGQCNLKCGQIELRTSDSEKLCDNPNTPQACVVDSFNNNKNVKSQENSTLNNMILITSNASEITSTNTCNPGAVDQNLIIPDTLSVSNQLVNTNTTENVYLNQIANVEKATGQNREIATSNGILNSGIVKVTQIHRPLERPDSLVTLRPNADKQLKSEFIDLTEIQGQLERPTSPNFTGRCRKMEEQDPLINPLINVTVIQRPVPPYHHTTVPLRQPKSPSVLETKAVIGKERPIALSKVTRIQKPLERPPSPKTVRRKSEAEENAVAISRKEGRVEAVRRYRSRQKQKFSKLQESNQKLNEDNSMLATKLQEAMTELNHIRQLFSQHGNICPSGKEAYKEYTLLKGRGYKGV